MKFRTKSLRSTEFYTIFVVSNSKYYIMNKEITEQENDLIEAIRNYKMAYPNGRKELGRYARRLFRLMMHW